MKLNNSATRHDASVIEKEVLAKNLSAAAERDSEWPHAKENDHKRKNFRERQCFTKQHLPFLFLRG